MASVPLTSAAAEEVVYPESGPPVMESQINAEQRWDTICTLRDRLRDEDIYVWGDLFLYYQRGNPQAVVGPDVFAVPGVGKHPRATYLLWEEVVAPGFVLEITSPTTHRQDTGFKRDLYASLGVLEYFLYDPFGRLLRPRLQGYRLQEGRYRPLAASPAGRLRSEVLGLELGVHDDWLRVWDDDQKAWLPKFTDAADAARMAQAQAAQAQAQAQIAEARTVELEAEVARLRALLQQRSG